MLSLSKFDSLTGGLSSYNYNVLNAQNNEIFLVGVSKANSCIPSSSTKTNGGPYSQSVSNIEDNGIFVGLNNANAVQGLSIYPNPFIEWTTVEFDNPNQSDYTMTLTDIAGKTLQVKAHITSGSVRINREDLSPGVYLIELRGDQTYRGRIVINK
jgi:hypothetical protein